MNDGTLECIGGPLDGQRIREPVDMAPVAQAVGPEVDICRSPAGYGFNVSRDGRHMGAYYAYHGEWIWLQG